jgi:hypothetical protein
MLIDVPNLEREIGERSLGQECSRRRDDAAGRVDANRARRGHPLRQSNGYGTWSTAYVEQAQAGSQTGEQERRFDLSAAFCVTGNHGSVMPVLVDTAGRSQT